MKLPSKKTPSEASLRGLHALDDQVAWASGTGGTFLWTHDGGETWLGGTVAGAETLDFRDVHVQDRQSVWLMSAGPGDKSKLFHTADGGKSWQLRFTNPHEAGFFDGFDFWDSQTGMAYSDPVDGSFFLVKTLDGTSWQAVESPSMPASLAGEASFAASGTGIFTLGDHIWFGTGAGGVARVFHSPDRGTSWTVADTPIRCDSNASGIFSLLFWDSENGVAVGGAYDKPHESQANAATTSDGGKSWRLVENRKPDGYRSGLALISVGPEPVLVAVGPTGIDISQNGGHGWKLVNSTGFNSVSFAKGSGIGWAAGSDGRIARLRWTPR